MKNTEKNISIIVAMLISIIFNFLYFKQPFSILLRISIIVPLTITLYGIFIFLFRIGKIRNKKKERDSQREDINKKYNK